MPHANTAEVPGVESLPRNAHTLQHTRRNRTLSNHPGGPMAQAGLEGQACDLQG